jgi:pSer/pThr/pTyr-binding forkhead associated (FHA) protein
MPEIIVKLGDNIVHKYIFDKEIMSVGRARDNDIVIENLSVSRNHARIRKEEDRFILTDLNSANGTYVNGVRVTRVEIVDEDVVTIGKHKLHFTNKPVVEEEIIGEAFGAERTMLVDQVQVAELIVTKGKQKDQVFKITKYESFLGRASDNDIRLHDWFVSKKHAVIIRQGSNYFIKDLGSWRGTMVNGKNVRDCELKPGDEVQLGTTILGFRMEGESFVPQITGRVPQELPYEEEAQPLGVPVLREFAPGTSPESTPPPAPAFEKEASAALAANDDVFAPLTEDELEALEAEEQRELGMGSEREEPAWAQSAESVSDFEPLVAEPLDEEEAVFSEAARAGDDMTPSTPPGIEATDAGKEDDEEEAALLGARDASAPATAPVAPASFPADLFTPIPATGVTPLPEPIVAQQGEDEVAMWERALKNKSRIIRRQAAKKLKLLTGRDNDWESEPR